VVRGVLREVIVPASHTGWVSSKVAASAFTRRP
jgi:hypothetical protein